MYMNKFFEKRWKKKIQTLKIDQWWETKAKSRISLAWFGKQSECVFYWIKFKKKTSCFLKTDGEHLVSKFAA